MLDRKMVGGLSILAIKLDNKKIKQQCEEQILKVGLETFMLQGYAYATIQKIAGIAGVTMGTIYNYYTSKDEPLSQF